MNTIEQWINENKLVEIECQIPDMTGSARGKFFRADKADVINQRLSEGVLLQTVTGTYCKEHEQLVSADDQDMIIKADPTTLRLCPWTEKPTGQIIYDCYTLDGDIHPLSSRNVLRHVLAQYEALSLRPVIAPEVEFYLLKMNTDPLDNLRSARGRSGRREAGRQTLGLAAIDEFKPLFNTMQQYCEEQELNIDCLTHETGMGQIEVNFLHGDALDLADQVFTFKRTMRQAAYEHDICASFMAKPMAGESGSSMHIHQSLLDVNSGENVFVNPDGEKSDSFYHYIAGLQHFTPKLFSFYAPNVNSYRRFVRHSCAPINMHWGYDNRTVGIRIPEATKLATRIENRFSGIDANPYLAIAASLASGLAGLKQKLTATTDYTGNAGDEAGTLSRSLKHALAQLKDAGEVAEIIGTDFINAYRLVKLKEFEEFNSIITPWEREHLLLNV